MVPKAWPHPLGFRTPARVLERHSQIVAMRSAGMLVKNIGRILGIDHSTVCHHLKSQCKCEMPGFNGRMPPMWAPTLFAIDKHGPLRAVELAALTHRGQHAINVHLQEMRKAGWAEYKEGLWRVRSR